MQESRHGLPRNGTSRESNPIIHVRLAYLSECHGPAECRPSEVVLQSRLFRVVDHCCYAWNQLVDQAWRIMSIGLRDWAMRPAQ